MEKIDFRVKKNAELASLVISDFHFHTDGEPHGCFGVKMMGFSRLSPSRAGFELQEEFRVWLCERIL